MRSFGIPITKNWGKKRRAANTARRAFLRAADPLGENSTSRVALGMNFGVAFFDTAPTARAQSRHPCLRAVGCWLGVGGGRGKRKVTPKFVPRATQTLNFPPGGGGLRRGKWSRGGIRCRGHACLQLPWELQSRMMRPPIQRAAERQNPLQK